jgi:hypothetical protein
MFVPTLEPFAELHLPDTGWIGQVFFSTYCSMKSKHTHRLKWRMTSGWANLGPPIPGSVCGGTIVGTLDYSSPSLVNMGSTMSTCMGL